MISLVNTNHKKVSKGFFELVKPIVVKRIEERSSYLKSFPVKDNICLYSYFINNIDDFLINDLEESFNKHESVLAHIFPVDKTVIKDKDLKKAMNYIFFYNSSSIWKPYEILNELNINCCPYCNRTYITTLGDDRNKFYRADFDHFLAKSVYPYFQLHFYNLIPSCVICNQRAKGEKPTSFEKHIYPYKEDYVMDAKFTYLPESYKQIKKGYGSKIHLKSVSSDSNKRKRIEENIKLFRLNQQYQTHHRELHFIIEKKDIHPDGYIEMLMNAFPNLFKNRAEAYEFIFGKSFNEEAFLNQPLSKFTKDISDELGII